MDYNKMQEESVLRALDITVQLQESLRLIENLFDVDIYLPKEEEYSTELYKQFCEIIEKQDKNALISFLEQQDKFKVISILLLYFKVTTVVLPDKFKNK